MSTTKSKSRVMRARFFGWKGEFDLADQDTLLANEWIGGPPSACEWSNGQFLLAETLRDKFDSRKIVKLSFRGIPDTEEEYDVHCHVLCKAPVRPQPVRHVLKGLKEKKRKKLPQMIKFEMGDANLGLSDEDRALRRQFNDLPLSRRIHLWQKYLASHFK